MKNKKEKIFAIVELHLLLFFYGLGAIFSKLAGRQKFLSLKFCVFYGIVLLNLVVYALFWQQILKKLPLVTAYANKAVTVVWGVLWGYIFFQEKITFTKIIGCIVIIAGIYIVVSEKEGIK